MTKTPEQMAEEFADTKHNYNPNFPRDVQHNYDVWWDSKEDYLAGYQAAVNSSNNSNGWISVKERLPEIVANCSISDDVLWLTRYGEIEVSFLETLRFEFRVDWGEAGLLKLDQFTHWMPLPAPPEEK